MKVLKCDKSSSHKLKRLIKALFLFAFILFPAVAFSAYNFELAYPKWEKFSESVFNFAAQIISNNKPAYEQRLTKSERHFDDEFVGTGTSPVIWQRVWAKNKTIAGQTHEKSD